MEGEFVSIQFQDNGSRLMPPSNRIEPVQLADAQSSKRQVASHKQSSAFVSVDHPRRNSEPIGSTIEQWPMDL